MKLSHAIKVAGHLVERKGAHVLSVEERIAVGVLIYFAKAVYAARPKMRTLLRAVMGSDELNQTDLPLDAPPDRS